jgi:hypothetical protein
MQFMCIVTIMLQILIHESLSKTEHELGRSLPLLHTVGIEIGSSHKIRNLHTFNALKPVTNGT